MPTNLVADMARVAPRSMAMTNPLFHRSFSALTQLPLGTPFTVRLMSTYQPKQSRPLFLAPAILQHLQFRSFGSSNSVSRTVLASREAAANRNPNSATAQNGFYQALLKANMPAIVVERYQSGKCVKDRKRSNANRR